MADVNLASLNFSVHINDEEFKKDIEKVRGEAKALNADLSEILELKRQTGLITKDEHASNMRAIKEEQAAIMGQQKQKLQWSKETAKLASQEAIEAQKVAAQTAKANNEKKKGLVIDEQKAAASQKTVAAEQLSQAAAQRRIAAEQNALRAAKQRETAEVNLAAAEERKAAATNRRIMSQNRLNASLQQENSILLGNSRLWREMKNLSLMYFSVTGATRLVSNLVQVSAEFEKQKVSLRAILRDLNGADRIFSQIKDLAVQSPFQFKELVTYTKQLSAFSIPMNELYDTTKMLADVSAGLGVGMDRLVLAYGQIRSASFLRGQEVRQLTEAGIPILEELRKQFEELGEAGITVGDVFDKISSRQVTFEMVEKVFKDMTSEGGKFYRMQEVLAETLSGKISNLRDAYQIMFAEIGEKTNGILVGSVNAIRSLADNYEKIGKSIVELVAAYGAYKATLITMEALNGAFVLSNHKVLTSIVGLVKSMKAALLSNPYALVAAGATAAAVAVYKLSGAMIDGIRTQKQGHKILRDFTKGIDEMNQKTASEIATLDKLYARLKTATEGTEEYDAAKRSILSQYDTYIQKLRDEGKEVDDLVKLYGSLKKAVQDAAYDKYRDMLTSDAKDAFENAEEDIMKAFNSKFKAGTAPKAVIKANAAQKEALWLYVTGARSASELIDSKLVTRPMLGFFEYLRKQYSRVSNAYTYAINEVDKAHKHLSDTFDDDEENLNDWQRNINDALKPYSEKIKARLGVDATSNWSEYVDDVQKRYKELNVELKKNEGISETSAKANREEISAILALNKALNGRILREYDVNKTVETESDDRVAQIQQEIDMYQRLKETYLSLSEDLGNDEAKKEMPFIFPQYGDAVNDDYDAEIERLSGELEVLAVESDDARKAWLSLQDALSKEKLAGILKAGNAKDEYEKLLEDWFEAGELFGEGSEFNISKVINKYKKNVKEINDKRAKAIELLYNKANETGIFGLGYLEEGKKIDEKALTDSANALKEANEEIRKQAEAWVRSWDGIAEIDISNMADLTTRELQKLMDALKKLSDNPEQYFGDDLKNGLGEVEGSMQVFIDAIKEYVKELNGQAEEKNWDKVIKKIRLYGKALKIATESLRNLAETAGWSGVSDLADHIDRAAEAATNFVQNLAEGDPLGAMASAVAYIAEEMVHLATSAMEYRNTIQEIQIKMEALGHSATLSSGVNSIFGTDNYRALKNAYALLDLMDSKISSLRDRLGSITAHVDKSKWWQFLMAPTAWYGWFQHFFGSESYSSLLDDLGADLFTETGRVNVEAIEALQENFDKLSASEKVALEQAIQDANDFNAALDQIDDVMSDLVGNLADNFADAIVDQWKEAGDAATDYGEILDDLATQYAKMYIRNSILDNVFDTEFEEDLKKMTLGMNTAGVMSLFDEKVKELEAYYPFFEDVLNGLSEYFNTSEADTESTLGNGIKSITEDTANLLASYVNAIRADVAAMRQMMAEQSVSTFSMPTLAEYLTQIQANTYNTAQNTASLLERIDSVMTVSDGPALRVFM